MAVNARVTKLNKKRMLDALEKSLGIVTTAAKATDIPRSVHYEWMQKDQQYREAVEALADMTLDFAESQLHRQIKDGNTTATIFYLKTKGKKRGYVERTEVVHETGIESAIIEWTPAQIENE
jgi:hypothetical protein